MGGEKGFSCWCCGSLRGSPPRGRGKDLVRFYILCFPGITPAWAGKSSYVPTAFRCIGDHPRVGGEKPSLVGCAGHHLGSPPRGRGKGRWKSETSSTTGITPAWAGKSAASQIFCQIIKDHPRVGGEKFAFTIDISARAGSPPRGRGKD